MNEISSLPSLSDLLGKNPNISPNVAANQLSNNFEYGLYNGESSQTNINAVQPVSIDKTTATDRVNAPGFAQMFENFIKGVDQKKKISKKETQDLILGRSDNIHEAVVKSQEAGVAFNLMIEVRNKLVDSYQTLMKMSV
ncbi:MAG: flagellar hook-basal body complex protein FliE [Verrucomicrobiota bacterium]|nr:flagellar hook-basal body complex protein FliE [Verrucomicrobiota bacterium]